MKYLLVKNNIFPINKPLRYEFKMKDDKLTFTLCNTATVDKYIYIYSLDNYDKDTFLTALIAHFHTALFTFETICIEQLICDGNTTIKGSVYEIR